METNRLEAFSDGVMAIILTITVLAFKTPAGAGWRDAARLVPQVLSYFLSFLFVAIYWVNHHIALKDVERVNVKVLWCNNALLFFTSFVPFLTGWVGEHLGAPVPLFWYFFDMFLTGVAFHLMMYFIAKEAGTKFCLDLRSVCTLAGYLAAAGLGFVHPAAAYIVGTAVNLWWLHSKRTDRILDDHCDRK